jgi:pimeloyl-ACP methyl ester carboxylesterase
MDLYFRETGSKDAETIIFLHASATSGWMWDGQVKEFEDYHCIVPDLPEHGLSIDVKPFTISKSAEVIAEIIRNHASNGKAHLVGISLGAQIIIQILSKAPELVDHAIISGTLVQRISHIDSLLKLLDYTIKVYGSVKNTDFFIKANMRTYNMPKCLFDKFKESTLLIKNDSLNRILKENMIFKQPDGLEKIGVPVLVMTGDKDYKIVKESAEDLLMSFQISEGYIAPNVGHFWNLEDPKLFNWVLRRWITTNSPKNIS